MAKVHGKSGNIQIDTNQTGMVEDSWSLDTGLVEITSLRGAYIEHFDESVGMTIDTVKILWGSSIDQEMLIAVIMPAAADGGK